MRIFIRNISNYSMWFCTFHISSVCYSKLCLQNGFFVLVCQGHVLKIFAYFPYATAFKFCLDYRRRTEFRKLCDIVSLHPCEWILLCHHHLTPIPLQLRNHLQHSKERQSQQYALRLDNPDTIQCLVDIRFEQLDKSISIDLWQARSRHVPFLSSSSLPPFVCPSLP